MNIFNVKDFSFVYPNQSEYALNNISFEINNGEFVTVCGKSGCGKSTLFRSLKPILAPHGKKYGKILFYGSDLDKLSHEEQAKKIGFVMQNPDNQLVTDKVWHELVFGLEGLSVPQEEIRIRAAEVASFFGIQNWFYKNVSELSGGQKQLLNLASVMLMQPEVLILDEPTSCLDPIAAHDFLNTLLRINKEIGTTVILSEHRLEEAFAISDRVIVMENGGIIADDAPENIGKIIYGNDMYYAMPSPMRIFMSAGCNGKCPVTVYEGRKWLENHNINKIASADENEKRNNNKNTVIELKNAWFRYEKNSPDIVKGLSMSVNRGELYAILGGNGTGKTTSLSLISGINKPYRGKIRVDGTIGAVPQNPQSLFIKNNVYEDLLEIFEDFDMSEEEKSERIISVAYLCEIDKLLDRHPYDLSGGEQQRAALAKLLLTNPQILLLDEPTKGLDAHFKIHFAEILKKLLKSGKTVIMVSHDIEFCAEYADRCAMFFDGGIISEEAPRKFFAGKSFYTTSANRMARAVIPNAVLTDDVIAALGGEMPKRDEAKDNKPEKRPYDIPQKNSTAKKRSFKRNITSAFISMILIPLTIILGVAFFGDRKYYLISMLIIPEMLIPFMLSFEKRRPKARELVIISAMCAIAVVGRGAFYMLPQFKPMLAIAIISGICLGGESGFIVGAMSVLVSNFFFGQGPWTPWQMLATGLVGFVAGECYSIGILSTKKASLCIFGILAAVVIYGGIINPASVIMYQENPSLKMFLSYYITGFPFDVIHGLSTAVFLFFIAKPMVEKLERIKLKYGLTEYDEG